MWARTRLLEALVILPAISSHLSVRLVLLRLLPFLALAVLCTALLLAGIAIIVVPTLCVTTSSSSIIVVLISILVIVM